MFVNLPETNLSGELTAMIRQLILKVGKETSASNRKGVKLLTA